MKAASASRQTNWMEFTLATTLRSRSPQNIIVHMWRFLAALKKSINTMRCCITSVLLRMTPTTHFVMSWTWTPPLSVASLRVVLCAIFTKVATKTPGVAQACQTASPIAPMSPCTKSYIKMAKVLNYSCWTWKSPKREICSLFARSNAALTRDL